MSASLLLSLTRLRLFATSTYGRTGVDDVFGRIQACGYAKKPAAKGKGKGMVKDAPKGPEVCKDPVKLTSHAMGVNIYKQGQDTPLQPPHQYPDWLFQIDLGPPKKLQDLDPESREYWKLLRKENMWRFNRLHKGKKL
nr:PREDICTED: 39S ribosomal protein L54, mitochondrial isoform X4 [Lepisosteus oculatus]